MEFQGSSTPGPVARDVLFPFLFLLAFLALQAASPIFPVSPRACVRVGKRVGAGPRGDGPPCGKVSCSVPHLGGGPGLAFSCFAPEMVKNKAHLVCPF